MKPGNVVVLSGADLAKALKDHQFVVLLDGERHTVKVTGDVELEGLVAKVVVPS